MEFWDWFAANWFVLLQSLAIVGSLLFTAYTVRSDAKERRVANLFTLTEHHRDLWENLFAVPELARVKDVAVDVDQAPVTPAEHLFVLLLILHINAAYRGIESGLVTRPEKFEDDLRSLFSLPIPKAVWESMKQFQDTDFVRFVESIISRV